MRGSTFHARQSQDNGGIVTVVDEAMTHPRVELNSISFRQLLTFFIVVELQRHRSPHYIEEFRAGMPNEGLLMPRRESLLDDAFIGRRQRIESDRARYVITFQVGRADGPNDSKGT
jgi:hypothetical protein